MRRASLVSGFFAAISLLATSQVFDNCCGAEPMQLVGHGLGIRSMAFSPDSKRLASCGDDGLAIVWDAANGQQVATLEHEGFVKRVAYIARGQAETLLALETPKHRAGEERASQVIHLWDVAEEKADRFEPKLFEGPCQIVDFAASPDGRFLAVVVHGESPKAIAAGVYRLDDLSLVARLVETNALRKPINENMGWKVFFTHARRLLLIGANVDRTIGTTYLTYSTETWKETSRFREKGYVNEAVLSAGGDKVATAVYGVKFRLGRPGNSDDSTCWASLWDIGEKSQIFQSPRYPDHIVAVSLSAEDRYLAAATWSIHGPGVSTQSGLDLYDLRTGDVAPLSRAQTVRQFETVGSRRQMVQAATFSPDGQTLASSLASPAAICLHRVADGQVVELLEPKSAATTFSPLAYSPDGAKFAAMSGVHSGGSELWLWSLGEGSSPSNR